MDKSAYQNCITPAMKSFPKGITKDERSKLFCQAAKICSGKAKDKDEAVRLCDLPKEPKAPRVRRAKAAGGEAAAGCPVCPPAGNAIPQCEAILVNELPSDEGINIQRLCAKLRK
jgi:hypothetical protein